MEECKGTSGPWIVDIRGGCVAVYQNVRKDDTNGLHCDDERNIAYSNKGAQYDKVVGYWSMDKKTVKDYTLIAAAPELLESLQDFMAYSSGNLQSCGHDFECFCRFDKARAAINKALGK